MSEKQTVTINGRHYDARSGLAVETPGSPAELVKPSPVKHRNVPHAGAMHTQTQRSQTLNRKTLKRPVAPVRPEHKITLRTKATTLQPSSQANPHIAKFAPHPVAAKVKQFTDIGPVAHPHVVKAHAVSHAKIAAPQTSHVPPQAVSRDIKKSAIHHAIAETNVNHGHHPKPHLLKRHPRALSIISATFALVLLGGYLTYLNMPSLSVRVAAAEAGINAGYPSYRPDGYSLNGVVGYSAGKVTMKFASNSGPSGFTLNQAKSSWDSAAVLDNYVTPRAGVSYVPYTERGLTIYTYGNNAAWVNGGVLYTIEGNAPLSSEQIRRIATSLI